MDLSLSRYIDTLRILERELDTCYQEAKLSAPISRQIVRMAEEIRALQLYRERQPGARLELCGYLAKWAPELDLGKTRFNRSSIRGKMFELLWRDLGLYATAN
ncbi:hypothetical protein SLS57_011487 [Botryosphaeria dothidea]